MSSLLKRLSGRRSQPRDLSEREELAGDEDIAHGEEQGEEFSTARAAPAGGSLMARIAAFEKAAKDATDPSAMQAKISDKSDRKKYNFAQGLENDVRQTRSALRDVCDDGESCTFGNLFQHLDGQVANLNRVLQNLKRAGEIDFEPEIFLEGVHKNTPIQILDKFWAQEYSVDQENVYRAADVNFKDVAEDERLGRSYVRDNLATRNAKVCAICGEEVSDLERMTVRDQLYHLRCLTCAQCGSHPRDKAERVSFDGKFVCSAECMKNYDAAHLRQDRC